MPALTMSLSRRSVLSSLILGTAAIQLGLLGEAARAGTGFSVTHTDDEWRKLLTPDQYAVLRQEGTERAFSSPLLKEHRKGTFACAGCDLALYSSDAKYESGTGWPSFWQPRDGAVGTKVDKQLSETRSEVHCSRCGGHLGHVFNDGPQPTGLRYCMNGVAMTFHAA